MEYFLHKHLSTQVTLALFTTFNRQHILFSGYLSFRNETGSIFIKTVCKYLQNHHKDIDLLTILTRVAGEVAHEYQTNNRDNAALDKKKQMPWYFSRLCKDVVFHPKI